MTEPRSALRGALLLACAFACEAARAQPAPSPSAASAAERAQKEADRPLYWIRVLADKPAPVRPAPAPRPVAAAAPAARATTEAREKATAAVAPLAAAPDPDPDHVPIADAPESTAPNGIGTDNLAAAVAATAALPRLDVAQAPAAASDPGLVQVKSVEPDFPPAVVNRLHKGNVEVRFEVDPRGQVIDATVVESSHPRLNEPAVEAIRQWRFKPTPTAHTALVNLVFNIDTEK
jgi:protein TonB